MASFRFLLLGVAGIIRLASWKVLRDEGNALILRDAFPDESSKSSLMLKTSVGFAMVNLIRQMYGLYFRVAARMDSLTQGILPSGISKHFADNGSRKLFKD